MRRADRLFQIIQILRRSSRPVTAQAIADELETSKRSVYRDIAALVGQQAPIRGEAGLGYVLEGGFDLPPLMLTADELEAAVLGAQWVAGHADASLARAAQDLIAKIGAAIPERLRPHLLEATAQTPPAFRIPPDAVDAAAVRAWIRSGRKMSLTYRDADGAVSDRVVWPVVIGYMQASRLLIGWCELRDDFRSFRLDRVVEARFLDERYPVRPATLRARWLAQQGEDGEAAHT
jgi:predicted DNA-binding transcriptional regulator YafY